MKKFFIAGAVASVLLTSPIFTGQSVFNTLETVNAAQTQYIDTFGVNSENKLVLNAKKAQGNGYYAYTLWVSNANKASAVGNASWIGKQVRITNPINAPGSYVIDVTFPRLPRGVNVEDLGIAVSYFADGTTTTALEGFGGNLGQIKKSYVENNKAIKGVSINDKNQLVLDVTKGQGNGHYAYYLWPGDVRLLDLVGGESWCGAAVKIDNIQTAGQHVIDIKYPALPEGFAIEDLQIGILYYENSTDKRPKEETDVLTIYGLKK